MYVEKPAGSVEGEEQSTLWTLPSLLMREGRSEHWAGDSDARWGPGPYGAQTR